VVELDGLRVARVRLRRERMGEDAA
jgi:hypothetical protein